ncbi:MAG: hypothetical protein ACOY3I_02715 [Verrucomicrobiota bacterium]
MEKDLLTDLKRAEDALLRMQLNWVEVYYWASHSEMQRQLFKEVLAKRHNDSRYNPNVRNAYNMLKSAEREWATVLEEVVFSDKVPDRVKFEKVPDYDVVKMEYPAADAEQVREHLKYITKEKETLGQEEIAMVAGAHFRRDQASIKKDIAFLRMAFSSPKNCTDDDAFKGWRLLEDQYNFGKYQEEDYRTVRLARRMNAFLNARDRKQHIWRPETLLEEMRNYKALIQKGGSLGKRWEANDILPMIEVLLKEKDAFKGTCFRQETHLLDPKLTAGKPLLP